MFHTVEPGISDNREGGMHDYTNETVYSETVRSFLSPGKMDVDIPLRHEHVLHRIHQKPDPSDQLTYLAVSFIVSHGAVFPRTSSPGFLRETHFRNVSAALPRWVIVESQRSLFAPLLCAVHMQPHTSQKLYKHATHVASIDKCDGTVLEIEERR